jgi:c-di-GMP-binding flagellar brake protein YcgR
VTTTNRRKHPRIKSLNLLSYVCVDENKDVVEQGMGRTLNVSEGGILLETHAPIDSQHTVSLTIALEDDLMTDINGRVVYSKAGKAGRFECGIEFEEGSEATLRILRKYIKAFEEQKNETA